MLNDRELQLVDDQLPDVLTPEEVSTYVTIPAKTFGFIVLPDEQLSICM